METPTCKIAWIIKISAIVIISVSIFLALFFCLFGAISILDAILLIIGGIVSFAILYGYAHIIQGVQDLVYLKKLEYKDDEEDEEEEEKWENLVNKN